MSGRNWDRAEDDKRRERVRAADRDDRESSRLRMGRMVGRPTTDEQRATLDALRTELGRPDVGEYPVLRYDAKCEISRLTQLKAARDRRQRSES